MQSPQVCILDYGSGNVTSVLNAFKKLNIDARVSNSANDLETSSHIILPGVGSFDSAMDKIKNSLPLESISQLVSNGKPFLGICVGMQVLAAIGNEGTRTPGLNYFKAQVSRLPGAGLPIPHIGWNNVYKKESTELFKDIPSGSDFYFVHSYYVDLPVASDLVIATSEYGALFPVAIAQGNLMGVQFHPEKSQSVGLKLLSNFVCIK